MRGAARNQRGQFGLRPGRDDLIEAGLVLVLTAIALVGFRTSFSGWNFLLAGLAGAVLGILIAHLANALRLPVIVLAVMTLVAFFLLGGAVALHGSVVPTGQTVRALATQGVHGWKDLLTTLPPVDDHGPLLVLPYTLGIFAGSAGFSLARRSRLAIGPAAASLVVLLIVILLGTQSPAAQALQGGVFGAIALGWAALRAQRLRPAPRNGSGRPARIATVAVLLPVAVAGSLVLGPALPGAAAHQRTVLRSYVRPPIDIGQYPSPLAGFRKYTKWKKGTLYDASLFTVTGLPANTPVRIATLDSYDGSVWAAANRPASTNLAPDTFQKVGTTFDGAATGSRHTVTVAIDQGYSDYWLPTAGSVSGVRFGGPRAAELASDLRYNLATQTGVVPQRVQPGDRYTLQLALPDEPALQDTDDLLMGVDPAGGAAGFLSSFAQQWSGRTSSQTAAVTDLGYYLRDHGKYTNGEAGFEYYLPGHSQYRLKQFVTGLGSGEILVGDEEQYAAAYALMIEELGTPARVVLGGTPDSHGVVRGKDIHAWVEVQLADRSWRSIPTDSFMKHSTPAKLQPKPQPKPTAGQVVPPPNPGRPHSSLDDASQDNSPPAPAPKKKPAGVLGLVRLPGWLIAVATYLGEPVLALALLCLAIVAAKATRRRVRRRRGSPLQRLATGWRELVDHARDLGVRAPQQRVTRREQGRSLAGLGITGLAELADSHVFGPGLPTEQDAAGYWAEVLRARKQMSGTVGRWRRFRAAVSLTSWRPAGPDAGGRA